MKVSIFLSPNCLILFLFKYAFYFVFVIHMQKTVVAVLDQMVNPHWPHLPKRKETYRNEEEREGVEGAWNSITDDPLDYQFYYHILDGDEGGRPPKIETSAEKKERDNPHFNWRNKSCLEVIAKSKNKVRSKPFSLWQWRLLIIRNVEIFIARRTFLFLLQLDQRGQTKAQLAWQIH